MAAKRSGASGSMKITPSSPLKSLVMKEAMKNQKLHHVSIAIISFGFLVIKHQKWACLLKIFAAHFTWVHTFNYRIVSNLTDISNYPDTTSNYYFTSNYTRQSMKFEFLLL